MANPHAGHNMNMSTTPMNPHMHHMSTTTMDPHHGHHHTTGDPHEGHHTTMDPHAGHGTGGHGDGMGHTMKVNIKYHFLKFSVFLLIIQYRCICSHKIRSFLGSQLMRKSTSKCSDSQVRMKWKLHFVNPKGKFILSLQDQLQGTSVYSLIQRS